MCIFSISFITLVIHNFITLRHTHMSDSDEFLDAESDNNLTNPTVFTLNSYAHSVKSDFSIEGPNSVATEDEDEFYDVIEDPKTTEQEEQDKRKEHEREGKTEEIPEVITKLVSPPLSNTKKSKKRLSILEFLQEEPEELEIEEVEDEVDLNKRETIYEFLASDNEEDQPDDEIVSNQVEESESSLSRLQSELTAETSDHEKFRKSFLNFPSTAPPPFPPKRDSLIRRANPLASFFTDNTRPDSSDSDSMISELTEAMTIRTDLTDLRLSRLASVLDPTGADYLKLAKRYKPVPVKTKSKQKSEFSSLFLIQELNRKTSENSLTRSDSGRSNTSDTKDPSKAIFVLKFSPDGQFLAAAGAEGIIKIWSLHSVDSDSPPFRLATIFDSDPIQILKGHTAEILDCAWSTNNFLLSASMDKTVRLWHYTRSDALGIFQHLDYVTSVAFNPRDPRVFLSGSLDCKLRLWSIQDRTILHWNELPPGNFITAVAFTRSGSTVVAGTSGGTALIFDTEGLRYNTQILVRSSRNKTVGKKITSIDSVPGQYDNEERVNQIRKYHHLSYVFFRF